MDEFSVVKFPASNDEYDQWVRAHPHGYVINAHKTGTFPMYWHRADCMHIRPDGQMQFVGGDFIKACALNPGVLAVWAKTRPEALNHCASCRDKWLKEQ